MLTLLLLLPTGGSAHLAGTEASTVQLHRWRGAKRKCPKPRKRQKQTRKHKQIREASKIQETIKALVYPKWSRDPTITFLQRQCYLATI